MLKCSLLCMMICGMLVSPFVVHADVVVEPTNNFYEESSGKCVFLGRNFRTNGEVSLRRAPNSNIDVAALKNDEIIYLEYSCLYEGEYWGLALYDNSGSAGWVKISQLLVICDYVAFAEEHFNEFYEYTGDYEEIKETGEVIVWTWPGSGYFLGSVSGIDVDNFSVSYAFEDDQGREWGFVPYLYGSKNFWVCISEPNNQDIPIFNPAPEPEEWETDTVHTEIKQTDTNLIILITALVVALVTGTAILIKVFLGDTKGEKISLGV